MPKVLPAHPVRNYLELKVDYKPLADKQLGGINAILGRQPISVSNGYNPAYLQHPKYEFPTVKELDKAVKLADRLMDTRQNGVKEVVRRRTSLPSKKRARLGMLFDQKGLIAAMFGPS